MGITHSLHLIDPDKYKRVISELRSHPFTDLNDVLEYLNRYEVKEDDRFQSVIEEFSNVLDDPDYPKQFAYPELLLKVISEKEWYLSEQKLLTQHGRRYAKLLEQYIDPGRMLDIGCAAGFVADGFRQSGWDPVGLETNDRVAEFARTQLLLPVATGVLEEFTPVESFDLINMVQVIAHFHDLRSALEHATSITADGGHWLIETWNFNSWTARLFGKNWHEYSPPSVLNWFSPQSLQLLCEQFGMQEVARGRPTKRLDGEHAKSLLKYRLGDSKVGRGISRALDFLAPNQLPIPYPAEDLFWMLLQKKH